jgi:RHS repeat-associated protein
MSSPFSGSPFRLPGRSRKLLTGRGRRARAVGAVVSGLMLVTLLPAQAAWAVPPNDPRSNVVLPELQDETALPPDEARMEGLKDWAGDPAEPLPEYNPTDVNPPTADTGTVSLDGATGENLVPVEDLPVKLGQATATSGEPAPPAPSGEWSVEVESRPQTEAADVDGAIITITPPAAGSTPVDVELDYSAFQDLYGTEWATRLKLTQLPECFLTTPELPECTTPVDVMSSNDAADGTVRATIDPAASQQSGLASQSGGGPVVLAASDSAAGAGGSYKATPLSPSGTWSAGGSSGGFTWTYPLDVPAAPAGPTPNIAFTYSSQSVDGKTSVTNGQASWIGDGWDYHPGFIERRYRSCSDDREGSPNNNNTANKKKPDLCWASDNLSLSLNGSTTELLKDAKGNWLAASGDGTRIEYKTKADAPKTEHTDKYDGEYWVVTTREGTQYWFGKNTLDGRTTATNSVFTVPVFGNHSGEPCNATAYADSSCTQAWRWNLDHVRDIHGNAMIIDWAQEKNNYAVNGKFKNGEHQTYIRGGYPTQILYGLRKDNLGGAPAGKVVFGVSERCIKNGPVTCSQEEFESTNYGDKQQWWDTPTTLYCKTDAKNCYMSAPTFWSTKRLTSVTTWGQRTPGTTDLLMVDRWNLDQSFPKQRTDTHPPLWLDSITRTGYSTTKNAQGHQVGAALPAVTFLPNVDDMPNRVATSTEDSTPGFDRLRVETIRTETGGDVFVDYSAPCTPGTDHPAPDQNKSRCYPVKWSPDPDLETPPTEWFNKYVVDRVIEKDRATLQPDVVTTYTYGNGEGNDAAWAKGTDEFVKPALRTYDQWRGYAEVTVRKGTTANTGAPDATEQSQTRTHFFRGMSGDAGRAEITVKDSTGTEELGKDLRAYQGRVAETLTYTKAGGTVASRDIAWPSATVLATRTRPGLPALEAVRIAVVRTDKIESISGGRTRTVRTRTTYDDTYGLPQSVHTLTLTPTGDTTWRTGDETCTTVMYVHNTDNHLIGLPERIRTTAGGCTLVGDQVISDTRTSYDALNAFGTKPTRGLPSQVNTIDGDGVGWIASARTEYDALGRTTKVTNADGNATSTTYTPATGPAFTVTTTNAAGHATVATLDPARGSILSSADANGRKTTSEYDELGRLRKVWTPSQQGSSDAGTVITYQTADNKTPAVTTSTLRDNGTYDDTVTLYDGLLRVRQTQAEALGGGRIVTDNLYNANGTVRQTNNAYLADGEPVAEVFAPTTVTAVPNSTKTAYDGLGRAVRTTTLHKDEPHHSAVTQYAGDWTLTRTGMNAEGTAPTAGSRAAKTWTDTLGRTSFIEHYTATSLPSATIKTSYTYDVAGNLATTKDAAGNTWTYTHDIRGRLTDSTDPDMGAAHFGYNALDQQIWTQDTQGRRQYTTYDVLGRQTTLREDSSTGPLIATWTYDTLPGAKGLPVASTRYYGTAQFTSEITGYDTEYRATGARTTIPSTPQTTGLAGTYAYVNTYTRTGKLQSVQLPATPAGLAAEKLITRYNGEGAPLTTSGQHYYTADTLYNPYGEVLRTATGQAPRRVWTTNEYDEETGLPTTSVAHRETASNLVSRLAYGYDTVGNITSITNTESSTGVDRQCFAHDAMGRLAHAWTGTEGCPTSTTTPGAGPALGQLTDGPDGSGYWQSYEFDAIGNRTRLTDHDLTNPNLDDVHDYTYGTPIPGQAGTVAQPHTLTGVNSIEKAATGTVESTSSYDYDTSGNTTSRVIGGNTQNLTWDRRNKLTAVDTDNNGTDDVTYLYDAAGNRLIENDGTTRTLFLGEAEITAKADGTPLHARRYYTHPGAPTTVRTTTGTTTGHQLTTLLSDHHGTATTAVEHANGQQITHRRYDPYGNPRGTEPTTWPDRHTFLGTGIDDPETALTHIGAREYDQTTGRFLSVDPVIDHADPLQINGYTYANGNPVLLSDPTGLAPDGRCGGITTTCGPASHVETVYESWTQTSDGWLWQGKTYKDEKYVQYGVGGYGKGYKYAILRDRPKNWEQTFEELSETPVPIFSVPASIISAGIDIADGEFKASVWSAVGAIPYVKKIKNALKGVKGAKGPANNVAGPKSPSCKDRNSFAPGTEVLLPDGTTKAIEDLQLGDEVLATDPETGETTTEQVTATITGEGQKNLVTLTLDTTGTDDAPATIVATDAHPFWVPALSEWVDATDLQPGQWLRTSAGTHIQITAVTRHTSPSTTVHNLTVANLHTYYVLAGATPVLVHNCGGARFEVDSSGVASDLENPVTATVPYNRATHYGGSQTNGPGGRAARAAGEGQPCPECGATMTSGTAHAPVPEHDPPLVLHYYRGGGSEMTNAERRAYARNDGINGAACQVCQRSQGAEMAKVSKAIKRRLGL